LSTGISIPHNEMLETIDVNNINDLSHIPVEFLIPNIDFASNYKIAAELERLFSILSIPNSVFVGCPEAAFSQFTDVAALNLSLPDYHSLHATARVGFESFESLSTHRALFLIV
jgi:hypothetical protein